MLQGCTVQACGANNTDSEKDSCSFLLWYFQGKDIEFVDVKIDGRYEREDKQPDVIATTKDNQQYIIEFTFDYKVRHKQAIDYKNLNCLEINLSNQTLESVEKFLLEENKDRIWFNNQEYFNSIEPRYEKANKRIKVKMRTNAKNANSIIIVLE